jgi:purine-cytosine permease-like protein
MQWLYTISCFMQGEQLGLAQFIQPSRAFGLVGAWLAQRVGGNRLGFEWNSRKQDKGAQGGA